MATGPELRIDSPGLRRELAAGQWVNPSVEANHWELFAYCLLLKYVSDVVRNRLFVIVRSDSMSACRCIRDHSASLDAVEMAHLARVFLSLEVRLNYGVNPVHIPGVENVLADPLSRGYWPEFGRQAAAWLLSKFNTVSACLCNLLISHTFQHVSCLLDLSLPLPSICHCCTQ